MNQQQMVSVEKQSTQRIRQGIFLSVGSQVLWGLAGNLGQLLFTKFGVIPTWMVVFRLLTAGVILLTFAGIHQGATALFVVWTNWRDSLVLILFSILAMLGIQLTYFMTISYSNAATATVLQFTAPVLVIVFLSLKQWRLPSRIDTLTVLIAVIGTFLLITNGNPQSLSISIAALFWGLLTATSDAVYILLPNQLIQKYGAVPIVAWSFLIGGCFLNIFCPVWSHVPAFSWPLAGIMLFMVILGTVFAYLMELQSLPLISPQLVSILQAVEPITATVIAVALMGTHFTWVAVVGILLVITTVFIQALPQRN